ncbi:MAG: phosphoribosylamine--glycine ligase [Bacteriovoracaceae bacterium]|nr:phosphoribosylamine--glycine ligase [Bacteriovoracaceae bacterium]
MRVLVVGQGSREHSLAWKLSQSPLCEKVFVAPGNAGMLLDSSIQCISLKEINDLLIFAKEQKIDFTLVGPEDYLDQGIVDLFELEGLCILGPSKRASQLECSKVFAKEIMQDALIPTAFFKKFDDFNLAMDFVNLWDFSSKGLVVKWDGLAQGKGVVVAESRQQVETALKEFLLQKKLGEGCLILEEKLVGPEVSAFYLCDGKEYVSLGFACDYKRIRDGNLGANTGGMGAYSPVDWLGEEEKQNIEKQVVEPLLQVMKKNGMPFKGILFVGLMMTTAGPRVLEFNVRFGDPETQVLMPLLDQDILPLFVQAAKGSLVSKKINLKKQKAVHVVLAAHGYPGTEGVAIRKNDNINLPAKLAGTNFKIFTAGVQGQVPHEFQTAGGRVMGVTAWGDTLEQARINAYQVVKQVSFMGMNYRQDIGL